MNQRYSTSPDSPNSTKVTDNITDDYWIVLNEELPALLASLNKTIQLEIPFN
jgi:hypothetical protein